MAKDRNTAKTPNQHEAPVASNELAPPASASPWSSKWRLILSIAVTVHMVAVFAEPFRFFTRSSQRSFSPDAGYIRSWLSAYIDFAYLHHGYFFFAPNPGPSHLISAQIGKVTPPNQPKEILIPDKTVQWPRLYYHRHFMLSEFLHNSFAPPEQPAEAINDPVIDQQWRRDREVVLAVMNSLDDDVRISEKSEAVIVRRIEHALPNDIQVYRDKWKLNDPRLYIVLPESLAEQTPTLVNPPLAPVGSPVPLPMRNDSGAEVVEGGSP